MSRYKMTKKIGLVVVILIVLFVAYNLIGQILDAVKSGDRLSKEVEQVYNLQSQNKELKKKLSEVQTPQFIEEQARNKLGLGKKGETIVIIPQDKINEVLGASNSAQEVRLPNWLGWWRLFFN